LLLHACLGLASPAAREIPPLFPVIPEVEALLDAARGEIGYVEARDGTTKYGRWFKDPAAQWCAEFLCWSAAQAEEALGKPLLEVRFPLYGGRNTGRDWFMAQGRYVARTGFVDGWGSQWYTGEAAQMKANSYVPQPGDWVFFSFTRSGDTTHAAVVEKCLRDENGQVFVQVIEGNNPDRVQRALYLLSDWRIQGYGTVRDVADIVLRPGAKGAKVRTLQGRLSVLGLLGEPDVTGTYGARTQEAVKAFQSMRGLNPTGIASQPTQLELAAYANRWLREHTEFWTVDGSR
ncbi:MAG TPA: peptidoglycan-binding protein, partial [Candidatus Limnocylindria bacterium]|nr:peptidoglycan-binding protein [Candidatus Limnocylindria bacterium]